MSHPNYSSASTIVPILTFLRTHPGNSFTAEEIAQQIACTPLQARIALDVLARAGLSRKEPVVNGSDQYCWSGT